MGEEFGLGLTGDRQGDHLRAIPPQGSQDRLQFPMSLQAETQAGLQGLGFGHFQPQGRRSADKAAGVDNEPAAAPALGRLGQTAQTHHQFQHFTRRRGLPDEVEGVRIESGIIRVAGRIQVEPQGGRGAQMGLAQIAVDEGDGSACGLGPVQHKAAKGALAAVRSAQNQHKAVGCQGRGSGRFPPRREINGRERQHNRILKENQLPRKENPPESRKPLS